MADDLNALEWALKNGDLQQVSTVVSKNKELASQAFPSGRHPLVIAADYGHAEVIEYLLSNGADVNVSDKYGITPLLAAIYEEHIDSIKLLLTKGADRSGTCPDGSSYIDAAGTTEVKMLLKSN